MWEGDLGQEREGEKHPSFSHWGPIRQCKSSGFGHGGLRGAVINSDRGVGVTERRSQNILPPARLSIAASTLWLVSLVGFVKDEGGRDFGMFRLMTKNNPYKGAYEIQK